jgi:hypothetical protein
MGTDALVAASDIDATELRRILDGRWADVRDQVRDVLRDPVFAPKMDLS